jgi:O-antigen/teichoic acid export membrane protein
MGKRELGLYIFQMFQPALLLLPLAVFHVMYPRISEMYGRNGSVRELARYLRKPTLSLVVLITPAVALLWLILPALIRILLPRYVDGVQAARWAILDVIIMAGLFPLQSVFFAAKKQYYYLVAIVAGIAIYFAVLMWLTHNEVYLEAFPQAMLAGRTVSAFLCYLFLYVLCKREKTAAEGVA